MFYTFLSTSIRNFIYSHVRHRKFATVVPTTLTFLVLLGVLGLLAFSSSSRARVIYTVQLPGLLWVRIAELEQAEGAREEGQALG